MFLDSEVSGITMSTKLTATISIDIPCTMAALVPRKDSQGGSLCRSNEVCVTLQRLHPDHHHASSTHPPHHRTVDNSGLFHQGHREVRITFAKFDEGDG